MGDLTLICYWSLSDELQTKVFLCYPVSNIKPLMKNTIKRITKHFITILFFPHLSFKLYNILIFHSSKSQLIQIPREVGRAGRLASFNRWENWGSQKLSGLPQSHSLWQFQANMQFSVPQRLTSTLDLVISEPWPLNSEVQKWALLHLYVNGPSEIWLIPNIMIITVN